MVFRFLAGCAGAGPVAIGGGTIGDMIPVQERGKYTAIFATGSLLGPIIGPIAGGYLTLRVNWRWSFWIVVLAVCVSRGEAVTLPSCWEQLSHLQTSPH
jgi:MFS family permease